MVALAVMVLRKTDPGRAPAVPHPGGLASSRRWRSSAASACIFYLPLIAKLVLPCWGAVGLLIYFGSTAAAAAMSAAGSSRSVADPEPAAGAGRAAASQQRSGKRPEVRLGARAIMLDHFGGADRAEPEQFSRLLSRAPAEQEAGREQIARAGSVDQLADRLGRHLGALAAARSPARRPRCASRPTSPPCRQTPQPRYRGAALRPAPGSPPRLANRMSIWPSSISSVKPSRWRSMQNVSDKSEGDFAPGLRATSIALTIADARRLGIPQIALEIEDRRVANLRFVERLRRQDTARRPGRCSSSDARRA